MNRLIVTADDFGLSDQVNEAVEIAHRSGILTTASLMISGVASADAVRRARAFPRLGVGLHVVLVEGRPTLPPELIPDLVDGSGQLRRDMARLGLDLALRPSARRQLRAEITAQFAAFQRTGLPLDHVDAHKHFHVHPLIARDIIAIGRSFGMRALRIPTEPPLPDEVRTQRSSASIIKPFAALLRARARNAGLCTANAVFGLAWSGALTVERMQALLAHLPPGLVEIYTHPATADRFPGSAPGYHYVEELEALRSPETAAAVARCGHILGTYADAQR